MENGLNKQNFPKREFKPNGGFNSPRLVNQNVRKRYFPKRRENINRPEVRRGIHSLSDKHLGMLLTMQNNSEVSKEVERELRKRHNGKVIFEL